MTSPSTYENIKPVPCVVQFSSRDANIASDAYMKNCYAEADADDKYAVKRPGMSQVTAIGVPTSGPAFSNFYAQGVLGSDVQSYTVFIMDDIVGFLASATGTLRTITIPLAHRQSRVPYRMTPVAVGGAAQKSLMQAYTMFVLDPTGTGTLTWIDLSALTGNLTPSLSELNATYYIMTDAGRIYSSPDYTTWPVLNYTQLDIALGQPLALYRQLNYLIAFGATGITAYYDAGVSPGSPLLPVANAVFLASMAVDGVQSIARTLDDELLWIGSGPTSGFSIMMMKGLAIETVSTEAVNRVLDKYMRLVATQNGNTTGYSRGIFPRGMAFKAGGHSFYAVTFPTTVWGSATGFAGLTMVFDIKNRHWSVWTQTITVGGNPAEQEWQPWYVSEQSGGAQALFVDQSSGKLTTLDPSVYQDLTKSLIMQIQTELYNWGNQRTKVIPATYLQADTLASTVTVEWTDDDYNTYSNPRTLDTSQTKKQIILCGSTTQRGWRLTHNDNTSMRMYGLEVEAVPGAL